VVGGKGEGGKEKRAPGLRPGSWAPGMGAHAPLQNSRMGGSACFGRPDPLSVPSEPRSNASREEREKRKEGGDVGLVAALSSAGSQGRGNPLMASPPASQSRKEKKGRGKRAFIVSMNNESSITEHLLKVGGKGEEKGGAGSFKTYNHEAKVRLA